MQKDKYINQGTSALGNLLGGTKGNTSGTTTATDTTKPKSTPKEELKTKATDALNGWLKKKKKE